MLELGRLAPAAAGLHPEDARGNVAALGLAEERAADHGIGAGEPEVQLLAIVLLQRVEREPEQLGDCRCSVPVAAWCSTSRRKAGVGS